MAELGTISTIILLLISLVIAIRYRPSARQARKQRNRENQIKKIEVSTWHKQKISRDADSKVKLVSFECAAFRIDIYPDENKATLTSTLSYELESGRPINNRLGEYSDSKKEPRFHWTFKLSDASVSFQRVTRTQSYSNTAYIPGTTVTANIPNSFETVRVDVPGQTIYTGGGGSYQVTIDAAYLAFFNIMGTDAECNIDCCSILRLDPISLDVATSFDKLILETGAFPPPSRWDNKPKKAPKSRTSKYWGLAILAIAVGIIYQISAYYREKLLEAESQQIRAGDYVKLIPSTLPRSALCEDQAFQVKPIPLTDSARIISHEFIQSQSGFRVVGIVYASTVDGVNPIPGGRTGVRISISRDFGNKLGCKLPAIVLPRDYVYKIKPSDN